MNALALLLRDHLDVSALLRRLQAAPPAERAAVVADLQRCWETHARAATDVFYPGLPSWAAEASRRAGDQHAAIASLLSEVAAEGLDQPRWDLLRRQVEEHVRDEHHGVFNEARRRVSEEVLAVLGRRIADQRATAGDGDVMPPERIVEAMAAVAEALATTLDSMLDVGAKPEPGAAPARRRRPRDAARSRRRS
jgi:hypothetical protein